MAGRRIDDHNSWIGAAPKGEPLPKGVHTKSFDSVEGAGGIREYPDTAEAVERDQRKGDDKVKSHPMKAGYRN